MAQARAQNLQWQRLNGPYGGNVVDLLLDSNKNVFALTTDEFDRFDPATNSWKQLISGLHFNFVPSAAIIQNRTDIAIIDGSAWLETYDGGKTWTRTGGTIVEDILTAGFNIGDTVYAGTGNHGVVQTYSPKYLSYWQQVDTSHWPVYALLHDSSDRILAGSAGTVYSSTDHGKRWTSLSGLPKVNVTTLIEFDGALLAGTQGSGIFRWDPQTSRWIALNAGREPWSISSFAVRDGKLYVSSLDAGVYQYGGGTTWTEFNSGLTELSVSKLLVQSNGNFLAGTTNGLFELNSDGSWEAIGLPITQVVTLLETPRHSLLARTNNGLFRSVDSGMHWSDISINSSRTPVGQIAQCANGTLLASLGVQLLRSRDNGEHWTMAARVGPVGSSPGELFYIGGSSFYLYNDYLYRSSNNGVTWQLQNNLAQVQPDRFSGRDGLLFGENYKAVYRSRDSGMHWDSVFRGGSVLSVGSKVRVGNVDDAGKFGSYYSSDGGDSWSVIPNSDQYQTYASAVGSSGVYFAANGGVLRAADLSAPYILTSLKNYSTAIATNGPTVLDFDCKHGLFYSTDNGNTWHPSQGVYDSVISLMSNASGEYFASTMGGIYRSEDSGKTFVSVSRGIEPHAIDPANPPNGSGLSVARNGHVFANAIGRGLAVSTDEGDHWRLIDTSDFAYSGVPFAISPAGRIFRAQHSGNYDLIYSDDEGATWTTTDQSSLHDFAFDSTGGVIAFGAPTGFSKYLYYSSDSGVHWHEYDGLTTYGTSCFAAVDPKGQIYLCDLFFGTGDGNALITTTNFSDTVHHPALDTESIQAIALDRNGDAYVAGSDERRSYSYRLYRSTDRGTTWTNLRDSTFPYEDISSLLVTDHYIYVGLNGSGILRTRLARAARVSPQHLGQRYDLEPYPNPADFGATIPLDFTGESAITIFNSLGACVVKYEHVRSETKIDTRTLPSGMYSIVVTSAEGVRSGKLIVKH